MACYSTDLRQRFCLHYREALFIDGSMLADSVVLKYPNLTIKVAIVLRLIVKNSVLFRFSLSPYCVSRSFHFG